MKYRERFKAAVNHEAVDRVPFDLCGTPMTCIEHPESIKRLREFLGYGNKYDHWYRNFDERILKYFDIDIRRVGGMLSPSSPLSGKISENEYTDCWGVTRVYTGLYWDIKTSPLKGAGVEDLDNFAWPRADNLDMKQIDSFLEEAKKLYNETDYVVCAEHPVFGIMELGCWMCGFDDFLLKMVMDPGFVIKFFDRVLEYQKDVIDVYYQAIGDYIHVTTSGDDFGTQTGPFISPEMFEQMVKPYYSERISYTRKYTDAYYFHHTCGSVYSIIPHIIEAGVDILNPIQPGARDMEAEKLKKGYGDSITFWGGIDTQYIMPEGTPDDVKDEVYRVLAIMAENGGYVLAPAHNIQHDVPTENIIALYDAGKKYYNM